MTATLKRFMLLDKTLDPDATADGAKLSGRFGSGKKKYAFDGTLYGGRLKFNTGGATYALDRAAPAAGGARTTRWAEAARWPKRWGTTHLSTK